MSRKGNLIKNTFILSIGTFLPKFITVLVTPILTAQLTKAEYGQYDIIASVVSLLLPAVTLQISAAAFRFLINTRKNEKDSTVIISTIYAFVLLVSVITSIIYYFFVRDKVGHYGFLICSYFIFDILLVTTAQMIRGLGKNMLFSLHSVIRAITDVVLLALLTGVFGTKNMGIRGVLIAMICSTVAPLVFLLFYGGIVKYIQISAISLSKLKELLSYSWPMVPNNLSGWVLKLSDRLVITAFCGIEATALYGVACRIPTIVSYFQNTFMQAWQENSSLSVNDSDRDEYYSQMCDWIYRLLFGFISVIICTTPILWKLLVKGDYGEAYYQLPILFLGTLFSCMASILGGLYTAHMKTKSVGITTTIAAFINFIIDITCVRFIGIWAGSISTAVSYLFLLLYRMKDIQKFQIVRFDWRMIISGFVIILIMGGIAFQNSLVFNLINIPICLLAIYLFDKEIIISLIRIIKKKINKAI